MHYVLIGTKVFNGCLTEFVHISDCQMGTQDTRSDTTVWRSVYSLLFPRHSNPPPKRLS